MKIYKNRKRISRKEAEKWIGKDRLEKRIEEAKETHDKDPMTEISWMDGMEIKFKEENT